MDWLNTAQQVLALITGLIGLIGTGIGAYFAIKNFIQSMKTKSGFIKRISKIRVLVVAHQVKNPM